jgi:diguanylate cyclase (GGDEF)-like protein
LLGRSAAALIADAPEDSRNAATPFTTRTPLHQVELWMDRPDGTPGCVLISAVPLHGADGAWCGARGVWRDVTEVHARAGELAGMQHREQLVGYITRTIRDEVEPDAMLRTAASAAARALGAVCCRVWDVARDGKISLAAEFGRPTVDHADAGMAAHVRRLQSGGDLPSPDRDDEIEIAGPDGRFLGGVTRFHRWINGAIGLWRRSEDPLWNDFDRQVMAKIADQLGIAQEQIANHEALSRQATTDALTGLLNRRGFAKQIDQEIAECERTGRPGALVYVDLDNFKAVNDRLGHPAGDAALKALAESLRLHVRAGDLVARLGGDEFALWLVHTGRDAAEIRAREILVLKDEIASYSAGPDKPLGLSVGVAVYMPGEAETTAELLARADEAMYEVKRRGKGSYEVAPGAAESRVTRHREAKA